MAEPIADFWPKDIGQTSIVTPLVLLKQEASDLGPKTNQLVKAEVRTTAQGDGNFHHDFLIVAPGLSNYQFQLFYVLHPITLYPLSLVWRQRGWSISSEEELVAKLKEIINDSDTKKIVTALLAQVGGLPAAG